jgi:O-antigen/teichoic acid export membrane protein
MAIVKYIKERFSNGHERTKRDIRNIISLFLIRGYSIAINLLLIPVTLNLLDDFKYGVWITLFNVLSWISIFDIGIGNGLRNKLVESLTKDNINEAREYVSTAYVVMFIIAMIMIVIFTLPWILIDWTFVFKVNSELRNDVTWLIGIAFFFTCGHFVAKLIGVVLTAYHRPALNSLIMSISNTFILIVFLLGKKWLNDSLIFIGLVYTIVPIIVLFLFSIYYFRRKFSSVKPNLKFFRLKKVRSLFQLGIQYFLIQISVVVILQTDSLIITHTLSPEQVTPYNLVYRYFSVLYMFFGIILTPLWNSYTEAYTSMDFKWIRSAVINQLKILPFFILLIILMIYLYNPLFNIWIGKSYKEINFTLVFLFGIQSFLSIWNNIFGTVLNGISKVRLSTILVVTSALINIPLSIYFAKNIGLPGVIIGTLFSGLLVSIFNPLQVYYFVFSKKKSNTLTEIFQ